MVSHKIQVDYSKESYSILPNQLTSRHGNNDIVLGGALLPNAVLIIIFSMLLKVKHVSFPLGFCNIGYLRGKVR